MVDGVYVYFYYNIDHRRCPVGLRGNNFNTSSATLDFTSCR